MALGQTAGAPGFLTSMPKGFPANRGFCCTGPGRWAAQQTLGAGRRRLQGHKIEGQSSLLWAGRSGTVRHHRSRDNSECRCTPHSGAPGLVCRHRDGCWDTLPRRAQPLRPVLWRQDQQLPPSPGRARGSGALFGFRQRVFLGSRAKAPGGGGEGGQARG